MASAPPPPPPSSQVAPPPQQPPSSTVNLAPTPAFRAFVSRLLESIRQTLSLRRPWSELLDRSAFSRPDSLSDAASRLRKNSSYFRVNYLLLLSSALALSLLTHPFSLLLLLLLISAWLFLYIFRPSDPPLVLFGRTFSDREMLGMLLALTVVVVFLTSVGSLIITALMLGLAVVAAHGAFRVPEDLFLDDQDIAGSSGLLSFLGPAAPAIVTRV